MLVGPCFMGSEYPQNMCAPTSHKRSYNELLGTENSSLCNNSGGFKIEVWGFHGLQVMPELQCLKKKKKSGALTRKKIFIFVKIVNALLFTKVPI